MTAAARLGGFDHVALQASAEAFPVKSDDGSMIRGEFYRAHYLIAEARAEISAGADDETSAKLAERIEDCGLRLGGMPMLEVSARRRRIIAEARKSAEAAAKAERDAAQEAERAAAAAEAEATAPQLRLAVDNTAPAEAEPACASVAPSAAVDSSAEIPVTPLDPAPASAAPLPVAPRVAARFLASSSLGAPAVRLPVAPSRALRIVR